MKSTSELNAPRFKIIAGYPGLRLGVGHIIELMLSTDGNWYYPFGTDFENETIILLNSYFTAYPHIFKALEWWENRVRTDAKNLSETLSPCISMKSKHFSVMSISLIAQM